MELRGEGNEGTTLRRESLRILRVPEPQGKTAGTLALDLALPVGEDELLSEPPGLPGRPERPALVPPSALRSRSVAHREGRGALLHALAHIELNAVNLALDLAWRFEGLPGAFYRDWIGVARDEARHFRLLEAHLRSLGFAYGDFPAHDGLWEMAAKTRGDLLARLALVPRTLEARGLDASPAIRSKLAGVGDVRGAEILDVILADEIGHVRLGNHWFRALCRERGLEPVAAYAELARAYGAPRLRGPFNLEARRAAGFQEDELAWLAAQQDAGRR